MGVISGPVKRFVCKSEGCGKSFNRRDYLSRHEANHSKVKPFSCEQCQMGFSRKDILEKHYKSQSHQEKRLQLTNKHKTLKFKTIQIQENNSAEFEDVAISNYDHRDLNQDLNNHNYISSKYSNLVGPEEFEVSNESDINISRVAKSPNVSLDANENNDDTTTSSAAAGMSHSRSNSVPEVSPLDNTLNWLFGDDLETAGAGTFQPNMPEEETMNVDPKRSPEARIGYKQLNSQTLEHLSHTLETLQMELFSVDRFNEYLLNFCVYFNSIYPIIHQPTFDPNATNTWLLITIVIIGMTFTNNENDYEYSLNLHKRLRLSLFDEIGDSPSIDLELLQAILLENFYGKLMGSSNQRKLSQIFHGTSINLLRHSGYFVNLKEPEIQVEKCQKLNQRLQDNLWRDWIRYETCKRTVFFGFILDSQHASLFRHSQLLSIFEIRLELPCTDALWNCQSPSDFFYEYTRQPKELKSRLEPNWDDQHKQENNGTKKSYSRPSMLDIETEGKWPSLLWSLRRLMQPYKRAQKEYTHNCFSQFSRIILLHGVLSITWDLKCRSLLDLGFLSKRGLSVLMDRLNLALINWKGYFETQIKYTNLASFASNNEIVLNNYQVSNLFWNSITLYQFSSIVLNVDTSLIFDVASDFIKENGNASNTSSPTKTRNKQKIQAWARSSDSRNAIIGSCKIVYTMINNQDIIQTIPHSIWVLYISCLTIWAYENNVEIKLSSQNKGSIPNISVKIYYNSEDPANIDFELAKNAVDNYIISVLDTDDYETSDKNSKVTNSNKPLESYWDSQRQVMALLVLVFYILKNSKWKSTGEMLLCLEKLLIVYN